MLRDVSLTVGGGEFVAVVGPSGSGKSTLINMLTGIDRPTGGDVVVAGTRLNDLSENQMARWRGRTLGVIFQFFQQQRAAIARALANDPPLLVGDEPTGNLDSKTADQVFALFTDLVARGKTLVMVTHDRDLAARVPRVVRVQDGRVVRST